jgi:hypothetical protein
MADNQKKKYTPEQLRQREEIGILIEKQKNKSISKVILEAFPKNKGTYYDNVVKIPLPLKFIELIKSKIGVDLSEFSRQIQTNSNEIMDKSEDSYLYWRDKYDKELADNEKLHSENKGLKAQVANQLKLIERYEKEISQLQAKIKKLEEKNTGTE